MFKKNAFALIFIMAIVFVFNNCSETVTMWTGATYVGTITKTDKKDADGWYFDNYQIGASGTWEFTVVSSDKIYMSIDGYGIFDIKLFSTATESKVTFTEYLPPGGTTISVSVLETNPDWADNNYKAEYTITGALK